MQLTSKQVRKPADKCYLPVNKIFIMIEVMAIIIISPPVIQRIDFYYQQDKQPGLEALEQNSRV